LPGVIRIGKEVDVAEDVELLGGGWDGHGWVCYWDGITDGG
jgi:hypothetical protein